MSHDLFLKEKFGLLLEKMSQKEKVVILIDEYDKPMIELVEADDMDWFVRELKSLFASIPYRVPCPFFQ